MITTDNSGKEFHSRSLFGYPGFDCVKNDVSFGVDDNSLVQTDNRQNIH